MDDIDWIHCNFCAASFDPESSKFFLMSCSHISCHNCLQLPTMRDGICKSDGRKFQRQSFQKLRPELQLYFKAADPIAILLFQKLSAIFKLRQQQFKSHVNMVTQVKEKIEKIDRDQVKIDREIARMEAELEKQRALNCKLTAAAYNDLKAQHSERARQSQQLQYREPQQRDLSISFDSSISSRSSSPTSSHMSKSFELGKSRRESSMSSEESADNFFMPDAPIQKQMSSPKARSLTPPSIATVLNRSNKSSRYGHSSSYNSSSQSSQSSSSRFSPYPKNNQHLSKSSQLNRKPFF